MKKESARDKVYKLETKWLRKKKRNQCKKKKLRIKKNRIDRLVKRKRKKLANNEKESKDFLLFKNKTKLIRNW